MSTLPKWTDERTAQLTEFVGGESPVSQATVAEAAVNLDTSTRSISSKLRKMGFDVELASAAGGKSFTDAQEATLAAFVTDNSGAYTYAEIAGHFEDGVFSPKSIQGKIADVMGRSINSVRGKALSLLRSGEIGAIPKQEVTKGASKEDPLATLGDLSTQTVEAIAEAIGKTARGVKTMLTRRGLVAADYDGASKKEKASA